MDKSKFNLIIRKEVIIMSGLKFIQLETIVKFVFCTIKDTTFYVQVVNGQQTTKWMCYKNDVLYTYQGVRFTSYNTTNVEFVLLDEIVSVDDNSHPDTLIIKTSNNKVITIGKQ